LYAPCPKAKQCDYFEWAEDSIEAAKQALLKKSSYSGFVARQVSSNVDRFRTLTVPELQSEAKRRGLNLQGKKQQLLMRLSLHGRDELTEGVKSDETQLNDDHDQISNPSNDEDDDSCTSSLELEVCGGADEDRARTVTNESDCDSSIVDGDQQEADGNHGNAEMMHDDACSVKSALRNLFGYSNFRPGQEWTIQRCLSQKRSLLVAPTGFGKSLCYALPAALMEGTCIVIIPLISLIEDQLRQLPPKIAAVTLSGGMSASGMACTIDDILKNRIKILFVSPERLTTPSFRRLFQAKWNKETQSRERPFPQVSLLCIDEAHCMSQWAHNFRPSYMRIRSLIECIQPNSVLAVTATAGPPIIDDMIRPMLFGRSKRSPLSPWTVWQVIWEGLIKNPITILNVDVEDFEPSIFGGAKKLLQVHLIENILLEVTGRVDNTENRVMLQTILDAGYYLNQVGGPEGPSRGYDEFQGCNEDHSQCLLGKLTKRHGLQANVWW
jgi:hypothetical protein